MESSTRPITPCGARGSARPIRKTITTYGEQTSGKPPVAAQVPVRVLPCPSRRRSCGRCSRQLARVSDDAALLSESQNSSTRDTIQQPTVIRTLLQNSSSSQLSDTYI